ncbi:glycosyl transferase family 39 [Rippkaea orientalis PCC 8801]|uniref:Glycosyl transferase family 39 n=1 Tax=Rippkaea orientalis (strain PCC 8801 / RF-1) TaxID=41431 RepID=B7K3Y6_RIPO1|nr:glycosyltransferase family 39 protein [Rippkaea orientalis]ACK66526.1 glycosyl transferase family 39 [Rippkaea orientalis PCC 8801]
MHKLKKFYNQQNFDIKWFLIFLIAALLLWLIGLGNLSLRDWDEGYYGTVAKDMFRTNNWLYLTYYNQPFLLKPPLMIWLITISYKLGGISEFTTRFPCAFLTALGVPLLYLVARNIFTCHLPAVLTGLVYLTLLPVVRHGRLAMLDGSINTFFIFSILCLLYSCRQSYWAIGVGIGLGLIALTKGILVIALGGIIGVFILLNNPKKFLKNPYLWGGMIVGFTPVFAWYIIQILHYGQKFIEVHFKEQNFDRLSTAVEGNKGSLWYYFIELLKYSLPWLLFLPGGIKLAWQKNQQTWAKLTLVGLILFMGIITFMGTKLPWYILPIYPFFALAVGAYLAELWQNNNQSYPKILSISLFVCSLVTLVGGVFIIFTDDNFEVMIFAIMIGTTLLLSAWNSLHNNVKFIPILVVGLYLSLGVFMLSNSWIWELNESFAVKPVATLIRENTPPGTVVYTSFDYSRTSLDFYSDRQVLAESQETLKNLAYRPSYLLLDTKTWDNFKQSESPLSQAKILGHAEEFILIKTLGNLSSK